jgi:hypothetical protein
MEYNSDFSANKGVDTDGKAKGKAIADHRYGSWISKAKVWIKVCNLHFPK